MPLILEKVLARSQRAVVVAGSPERVEALNAALWTYNDRAFLPHGSVRDGFAEEQPVWLATSDENPNGASVLVLTDGAMARDVAGWPMVIEMFDGANDEAREAARTRWKSYGAAGHAVTYWKQNEQGGWENGR